MTCVSVVEAVMCAILPRGYWCSILVMITFVLFGQDSHSMKKSSTLYVDTNIVFKLITSIMFL